jgi:AraC-like DNA-binding protein
MYYDKKTGKMVEATTKSSLLLETKDLRTLSSGTVQENLYADYGNSMKALANQARKEYKAAGRIETSKAAKETYASEVARLEAALDVAARNAPKERQAHAIANSRIKAQIQDNPDMDKKAIRKLGSVELNNARIAVGASGRETKIHISPKEWEAIQAGAISDNKLTQILRYADKDEVRKLATPKTNTQLSAAKTNKIKQMQNSGYTLAEIADAIGCSTSTISKYLND